MQENGRKGSKVCPRDTTLCRTEQYPHKIRDLLYLTASLALLVALLGNKPAVLVFRGKVSTEIEGYRVSKMHLSQGLPNTVLRHNERLP